MSSNEEELVKITRDDWQEFVRVWNTSSNTMSVMRKMGQPITSAQRSHNSSTASRLRRMGYFMRSMRRGPRSPIDEGVNIGYSLWVKDMTNAGVLDPRELTPENFERSLHYDHYVEYGEWRFMQIRQRKVNYSDLPSFEDWLVQTGRSADPSITDDELERIMDQS